MILLTREKFVENCHAQKSSCLNVWIQSVVGLWLSRRKKTRKSRSNLNEVVIRIDEFTHEISEQRRDQSFLEALYLASTTPLPRNF